jgi:hypothetical protein
MRKHKIIIDDKLVSLFPDREIANLDANKQQITIRDMVGMRNGFKSLCIQWDEANLAEMIVTPDWVQFALEREVGDEPGINLLGWIEHPWERAQSPILQKNIIGEFGHKVLVNPRIQRKNRRNHERKISPPPSK